MTDLLSALLTTAMFVIWCVLPTYHWHLFPVLCLELSSEKKTRKGVEAETQQEESWAFSAFAESFTGEAGATWFDCKPLCYYTELSR